MTLPLPSHAQDPAAQDNFDEIAMQFPIGAPNLGILRGFTTATTSGPATNSLAFVDLPEMSVTATFRGGTVVALFTGMFQNDTLNALTLAQVQYDGASFGPDSTRFIGGLPANAQATIAIVAARQASAGSHTVKVQWLVTAGNALSNLTRRQLIVLEI